MMLELFAALHAKAKELVAAIKWYIDRPYVRRALFNQANRLASECRGLGHQTLLAIYAKRLDDADALIAQQEKKLAEHDEIVRRIDRIDAGERDLREIEGL